MLRRTAKSGSRILDPSNRQSAAWTLYELDYVWREAQADADLAYRDWCRFPGRDAYVVYRDRKSTRLNSSHGYISYAVFCLKKKKKIDHHLYQRILKKKIIELTRRFYIK